MTTLGNKMNYYVIPASIMESISYYIKESSDDLNMDDIHFGRNGAIDTFMRIFKNLLDGELETREEIHDILDALNKRKQAIQDITNDVMKRREEGCSC